MEIVGLEPRRSDLARGIVIARERRATRAGGAAAAVDATGRRRVDRALAKTTFATTSRSHDGCSRRRGFRPMPPTCPVSAKHSSRSARRSGSTSCGSSRSRPGSTACAWLELEREHREAAGEVEEHDEPPLALAGLREREVLYAAPKHSGGDEDDDDDDDDDDDGDDRRRSRTRRGRSSTSHWRNGAPPFEHSVSFPIEHYPEIIDDYESGELRHRAQARRLAARRRRIGGQRVLRAVALGLSGRARR